MENKKTNLKSRIGNKQPGGQATPSGFYFCRRKKGGKMRRKDWKPFIVRWGKLDSNAGAKILGRPRILKDGDRIYPVQWGHFNGRVFNAWSARGWLRESQILGVSNVGRLDKKI